MRRSARSMILMAAAAGFCLSGALSGDRPSHSYGVSARAVFEVYRNTAHPARTSRIATMLVGRPRPSRSFGRTRTWHYRLKSVLQSKDGIGFQPTDLGPADSLAHANTLSPFALVPITSCPRIPLRC